MTDELAARRQQRDEADEREQPKSVAEIAFELQAISEKATTRALYLARGVKDLRDRWAIDEDPSLNDAAAYLNELLSHDPAADQ